MNDDDELTRETWVKTGDDGNVLRVDLYEAVPGAVMVSTELWQQILGLLGFERVDG